jgi:hypothetical protein
MLIIRYHHAGRCMVLRMVILKIFIWEAKQDVRSNYSLCATLFAVSLSVRAGIALIMNEP